MFFKWEDKLVLKLKQNLKYMLRFFKNGGEVVIVTELTAGSNINDLTACLAILLDLDTDI